MDASTCRIVPVKLKDKTQRSSTPKLQETGPVISVEAGEQEVLATFHIWCLVKRFQFICTTVRGIGHGCYLLVISNEDEMLASFTQSSNGVSLKHLCCLFYNDNSWLYFLQDLTVFGST